LIAAVGAVATPDPAAAQRSCDGQAPTLTGTPAADVLTGTAGRDVIRSGRGNDRIAGLDDRDTICAGPGEDVIEGGAGDDRLRLGAGDDRADAGSGDDRVEGQGGSDDAAGGDGTDACLTESLTDCEADLNLFASGTPPYTGGDDRVFVGSLIIENRGPTPVHQAVAHGTLPPQAEFVAAESDRRCREVATDRVRCFPALVGVGARAFMDVAFRFPACPAPGETITFEATVEDVDTTDPRPADNRYSITLALERAPSCP
jgi:Ca2+-binding RTX toxin-like protein